MQMIDLVLFFPISQGTLLWQLTLWKNGKLPKFVALASRNGMGYHYLSVLIAMAKKLAYFVEYLQIYWTNFRKSFHHMKALYMRLLYLIF